MKKKGFTLVEMIVVVTILALLAVMVVPKVKNTIANNKKKVCNDNVQTILSGAESYVYMHTYDVDSSISNTGTFSISVYELQSEGLIPNKIKNPYGGEFDTSKSIVITKDGNTYKYNYESECN